MHCMGSKCCSKLLFACNQVTHTSQGDAGHDTDDLGNLRASSVAADIRDLNFDLRMRRPCLYS